MVVVERVELGDDDYEEEEGIDEEEEENDYDDGDGDGDEKISMIMKVNSYNFLFITALVKSEVIVMEQDEPFGQITIFIGPNW